MTLLRRMIRLVWAAPLLAPLVLAPLVLVPGGCTQTLTQPRLDGAVPIVRVRVLENRPSVTLLVSHPPTVTAASDNLPRRLNVAAGKAVSVQLKGNKWRIGNVDAGAGPLTIIPQYDGTVTLDGKPYRGQYRFVPTSGGRFDVVNDVDIDSYLKSVVSKELYRDWDAETYKAQSIIARTYALHEAKSNTPAVGSGRHFDLHNDQRSQVYGGMDAETDRSQEAVDATAGIVVAHGPVGQERIFKAYFSAACGGIAQSAADAFGDRPSEPLSDWIDQGLCSASPKFNWGPIVVNKAELTRRIILWGRRQGHPVQRMGPLQRIDAEPNRWGRPVRYFLTDTAGVRYLLRSEELRHANNIDAPDTQTLPSSFMKIVNDPQNIRFVEGHGHGHGVGMCQWGAQRRAELGMRHEDIVIAAYPGSVLVRAY